EGGVWALASSDRTGDALRQQAQRLPELERPHILIGSLPELTTLLTLRGEADLRFDRIIGRNVFTRDVGRLPETLVELKELLGENGRFCFIQMIPRHTQRLYKLVDWTGHDELSARVTAVEEAIYHDASDPLVNWDENDLLAAFGTEVEILVEQQVEERSVTESQIERWFTLDTSERVSYADHLVAAGISKPELDLTKRLYQRGLVSQVVRWETKFAYITTSKQ
ncbi:MAG: hypothetical protein KDE48_18630, partial [Anaerolineales bacterium]|nr:hypothetical protein [Anaerolineales bacterium]